MNARKSHTIFLEKKARRKAPPINKKQTCFALKTNNIGVWSLSLEDHTAMRSLEHDRIFGYKMLLPNWTYEMFLEHVLPEERTEVDQKFQQAIETRGKWSFECRIRRTDGEIRWIQAEGHHKLDSDGMPKCMLGIVKDITEYKKVKLEQEENERLLSIFFHQSGQSFWHYRIDGDPIQQINNANAKWWCEFTGQTEIQRTSDNNMGWLDAVHEEDRETAKSCWLNFLTMNNSFLAHYRVKHRDGNWRWLEVCGVPIQNACGAIEEWVGIIKDITECKLAEETLRKSEETFRALFEKANEGIFIMSQNAEIVKVNESFAKMHGYTIEEMQNIKLQDLDIEDQSQIAPARIQRIMAGEILNFEVKHYHKNGNIIDLEVSASWFPYKTGSFLVGFHRDITKRKQMEETLRLTETRYRSIVEDQDELICRYLPNGRLSFVNNAYARYYKKNPAELIDKNFIPHIPEPDLTIVLKKITEITKENPTVNYTHRIIIDSTNETRWQCWTQHGIYTTDGHLLEYQAVGADITDRIIAENKIKSLLAEKEIMLREVHHRIKNNMNLVAGIMFLQSATLKDSEAVAALKDTRSRVLSMMVLYDKLYCNDNFDKLSFKKYFSSLVDEIIDNFPNKGIVKIEKSISDFSIDAKTASELGIVVNELLTNIMKYAFTGRNDGLITISAEDIDNHVTLKIGDNGIGIPESIDIDNSNGFGLRLVCMMTKSLRGTIKIERNNGTKFILEFNS